MSEQPLREPSDERLDENLSRLLDHNTQQPQLPADAEATMLAALIKKQAELHTDKEQPVSRATTPATPSKQNRSHATLVAVACLLLVGVIIGAIYFAQPADETPGGLGPQATIPNIQSFDVGDLTRKVLEDGTIVIAHSGTKYTVTGARVITLDEGDLYLIVAKSGEPFVVRTSDGEVIATGTRFVVSTGKTTTAAVAQGQVTLASKQGRVDLRAGEQGQLRRDEEPTRGPAPRLSYLVSWAKEALAQDELLVEKAESENGLVALDPWGQQVRLSLRKYDVDVYIEDGIARTTIDQTFFNHNPWNTEGTFYFPLPPDASVSRLAMYVAGTLNEGGMVERGRGQQIYNDILYQRRDPALLEMMEGNVFKMRIFPLEGRQEKRIFLSYTQDLDELYGTMRYWFPMDHTNSIAGELSIRVRIKDGAKLYDPQSSTHELEAQTDGDDLVLKYNAEKTSPDQDLLLHLIPSKSPAATRVATCEKEGHQFAFARFAPEIPGKVEPQPRQWIVVNDVSASRSKIDTQAQQYILQRLIEEADDEDTLFLINLNTRAESVSKAFTAIRSDETRNLLHETSAPRLGATNLVAGMKAAAEVIKQHKVANPHILYLGDGVATDGSTEAFEPIRAVPRGATFVGIGVGKKVDSLFLQESADRTGGTFTTINPDEDIDWRVFDLLAALNTPRLTKINIMLQDAIGQPIKATAYPNSRSLAHGETLAVVARCESELPAKIVLSGQIGDKPYRSVADVSQAKPNAEYIARLWAKRHIDELLKSDMGRNEEIVALSQRYYVVTPLTSLIVLEDDKMYEEYGVERGRVDHWALYPAPAKIDVVQEPVDWKHWGWYGAPVGDDEKIEASAQPQTVREIVDSVQLRIDAPFYYWQPRDRGQGRFALYQMLDSQAKPTKLLTYWLLLAAGEKQTAALMRNRSTEGPTATAPLNSDSPPAATTPAPQPEFGYISRDMAMFGHWESGPQLQSYYFMPPRSMLLDGQNSGRWEMDFGLSTKPNELAPPVLMGSDSKEGYYAEFAQMDVVYSGRIRPATRFGLGDGLKKLTPSMTLSDFAPGRNTVTSLASVRPELMQSFEHELDRRWSRVNNDIRDFNRQYGYWGDWGGWYGGGDSIDLTRSYSARWYGGLEALLESDEREPPVVDSPPIGALLPPFERQQAQLAMPANGQGASQGGGERQQAAMAWIGSVRQSLCAQPGSCSVLAADYLTVRRDELVRAGQLSDQEKAELEAINEALRHIDVAAARLEDTGPLWGGQGWNYRPQPWTFQPPTVQVYHGYNWSFDLTRYTPALHSNSLDILSEVVEQYGAPPPQGKIDDAAESAIAAARESIESVKMRFTDEGPELLIASGDRFAMTHRTDMYLQERMVCDGEQILHLYDELGLAARRPATALRLAALRRLAPQLVESAEALAERYDVALAEQTGDGFTLKLTPIGPTDESKLPVELTVRVDNSGRIHEKLLSVDGKLRLKLAFEYGDEEVTAQWLDAEDKQLAEASYVVQRLDDDSAFALDADEYVTFDMPLRKPSYYEQKLEAFGEDGEDEDAIIEKIGLKRHFALAQIQQLQWRRWGGTNSDAQQTLTELFDLCQAAKQPMKIGDLALLGSAGVHNAADVLRQFGPVDETHPVCRYYALRNTDWTKAPKELKGRMDGLLGHLAAYQASASQNKPSEHYDFFAKTFPDSPLLLAATFYAANWGNNPQTWSALYDNPRWRALAMFMSAGQLATDEQRTQLAEAYAKMHDELAADEIDAPVTPQIVGVLKQHDDGAVWEKISTAKFVRAKKADSTAALLKFAEDAMSWGEAPLADEALDLARERLAEANTLAGRFALAQTLWAGGRAPEAMKLYEEIFQRLEDKDIPPSPGLLASVARLAQQAGDLAQAIDLEEQALAAEHPHLPDLINLQAFRQRYNWLWQQYQSKVAEAVGSKDKKAVEGWLTRAETTWQRWHEIDPDNHDMIAQMATLQTTAGRDADAWLYLSTIIDQRPRDAASYYAVSQWHNGRNELDDAQKWLAKAYAWDTANPRWLWERAGILQQMGRKADAREIYEQIVAGEWANGLQGYVEQANEALQ